MLAALLWNPIVAKELRSRMRGWHAAVLLTAYLCAVGGLGCLVYSDEIGISTNVVAIGSIGGTIFKVLAATVLVTVALVAPGLVGPAISGEREHQTLDLLLVTPLRPARIVIGKLVAALAFVVLLVVVSLPLLSVALLLGGVPLSEVLEALALTLVFAFTLGALSMLFSVVLRRVTASTVVSYLAMLALALGPIASGALYQRIAYPDGGVSRLAALVDSVSPPVGAASLLDSNESCGGTVLVPLGGGPTGPTVNCQSTTSLGPLGSVETWQATLAFDGAIAVAALGASVLFMRRQERR
jgi:ABC-type transport system involved in multi-copper enzyme maturation permease subunit